MMSIPRTATQQAESLRATSSRTTKDDPESSAPTVGARVHVEDARFLHLANSVLHDQYFDPEHIAFDDRQGILTIPLELEDVAREEIVQRTWQGRTKRTKVPVLRGFLKIAAVTDWQLKDTEAVGTYDFNELVYEEGRGRLRVETNIPLELSMSVSRLDVQIELTRDEVGSRPVRHLPGGGEVRGAPAGLD